MNIKLELIADAICRTVRRNLPALDIDVDSIANTRAVLLLSQIKSYICNEDYSDFDVVERIVCLFEDHNISCGNRHDF